MKRRDVLKGAAVAAGAAVVGLPAVGRAHAERVEVMSDTYQNGRSSVYLTVLPDAEGKFASHFQRLVEGWERATSKSFRAVGAVSFEPLMEDGEPWLIHPAWEPQDPDKPSTLYTKTMNIFRDRRWMVIDRAVNLRLNGYWRQEYAPHQPTHLDGGGMSIATGNWRMFIRVARKHLYRVRVHFEAIPLSELQRYLGVTSPEYNRLEEGLVALENLRKADKLTPRAYYTCRQERLDRLEQLETEALS